ncbi:MAG: hypothetical protein P8Z77_08490 [Candidatus Thiodiazotropha sp.]
MSRPPSVSLPLLRRDWSTAFEIFFFTLISLYAFAAAFQGHLERDLKLPARLLIGVIAVCLLYPGQEILHWVSLLAFTLFFAWDYLQSRRLRAVA